MKWRKDWRISCDVGKATERLENDLWRRWSEGQVWEWALLILQLFLHVILQPFRRFTYVTVHSPILPLLHLRHNSFSNHSFASPTSEALHLGHLASRPCHYEEVMLLCKPLPANATGSEIFRLVSEYLEENRITWDNCVHVCTDGAKAMVEKAAVVVSRIKSVAKNCKSNHCVLHRQALDTSKMPQSLKNVLNEAAKISLILSSH